MRSRHGISLATAMLAAAMGGVGATAAAAAPTMLEFKMVGKTYENGNSITNCYDRTSYTRARFVGRIGGNQRQRRKDKRRSNAAGNKKAFKA